MRAEPEKPVLRVETTDVPLWTRPLVAACKRIQVGSLHLSLPGGTELLFRGGAPGPVAAIEIASARLPLRLALRGELGLAEAYMAGEWDSPDLAALLELGVRNEACFETLLTGNALFRALDRVRHVLNANTRRGSRRNISTHYDLGNGFYQLWLDRTMTYSAALFDRDDQALERAQANKYERMLALLAANPGAHILEIGCGWGGFACAAAQAGHRVTAITLSPAQLAYARQRIARAGLEDQVELRLQDYRDLRGTFDHVVSIEMFEAVGEQYWPAFFARLHDCLKPGGRAALQVITIDDDLFPHYRRGTDFIQRYIFPGGLLPAPSLFFAQAEAAGLAERSRDFSGSDYAETLARWERRFLAAREQLTAQGFGERFLRMWRYYMAYCQAGFRTQRINLMRTVLERPRD